MAVNLAEILDAREMRSKKRNRMSSLCKTAVIQLCINSPGSEKNSTVITDIFSEALKSILDEFDTDIIEYSSEAQLNTGPEAFIAIDSPAPEIKARCCDLESTHPLGRLWDIDVYNQNLRPLSRRELGLPERRCYLCGDPAQICARSRRHSYDELKLYILNVYQSFSNHHGVS